MISKLFSKILCIFHNFTGIVSVSFYADSSYTCFFFAQTEVFLLSLPRYRALSARSIAFAEGFFQGEIILFRSRKSSGFCLFCDTAVIKSLYFAIKDFLLLTTSKITAARRTAPFTTFCIFWSVPMILIPWLMIPIRTAPTITPGTVPVPP